MRQKLTTTALQLSIILLLLLASTPTGTASNVDDLNKFSKPINLLCSYTGCPFTMDKYIQTIKNIETQPEYQQDTTQPPANENKQTEQINADPYTTNDNTLTPITQTETKDPCTQTNNPTPTSCPTITPTPSPSGRPHLEEYKEYVKKSGEMHSGIAPNYLLWAASMGYMPTRPHSNTSCN